MDGFERRKERNKDHIRQVALDLFRTHGFKKVSISDVARKASVSPVTVYNHFGSKEGLVRDVIKHFVITLMDRYKAVMESDKPFMEKMELILFDKTEIARQFKGEMFVEEMNDPELREFLEEVLQKDLHRRISEFFEEGKRQGYINPELSNETIHTYYEIFRKGMMSYPDLFASPAKNARLVRELSFVFLYGIMGRQQQTDVDK